MCAKEAALKLANGNAICVTTIERRKRFYILKVLIGSGLLRLCPWKGQEYPIPELLVGATFCLGRMWIVEVRQGQVHPAEFRFTDRETRLQGEWNKNPTAAFKSTYETTTGEILPPSFNGRAEVGVFSDAVRAILVALDIERLQALNSPLVQHFNTKVTVHSGHVHQDLLLDPLVAVEQEDDSIDSEKVASVSIHPDSDDGHLEEGAFACKRPKFSDADDEEHHSEHGHQHMQQDPVEDEQHYPPHMEPAIQDMVVFDEFMSLDLLDFDMDELFDP